MTTETLAAKRGRDSALGMAMVTSAFPDRVFDWPKDAGPMRPPTLQKPQVCMFEEGLNLKESKSVVPLSWLYTHQLHHSTSLVK